MKQKYIHDIYYNELESYDGYESYCYQNCQRLILEYEFGREALLMINTAMSIECVTENDVKIKAKRGMRSLLPSVDKFVHRISYGIDENANSIFEENIKFISENDEPIIVGADTYYLPHSNNYMKKHAKHTMILCGYDLKEGVVYIIDWYKSWCYKGKMSIKDFLEARNSQNADDGTFYSGTPIGNNWAYIEKIEQYDIDELFYETVSLSKENYFNNDKNGIISTLVSLKKYISSLEEEKAYDKLFFEIYTLVNRKKIFLEYVEVYSNLKNNVYREFVEVLKKNTAIWDVFVVLLLKQSKRYNEKTRSRFVKKMTELIDEEMKLVEILDKSFR